MTEINDTQVYINYMMRKLPDAQKGAVRKIKKGDCLWNIAKQELNNPKATNKQISEYMLLIAKLNGLETLDKMNNLKINDEIYMPVLQGQVPAAEKPSGTQTKTQVQNPKTDAEQAFAQIKDDLFNDESIRVVQASPRFLRLYHVYQNYTNKEVGYTTNSHPVISFNVDANGKFQKGSFEGEKNTNNYGYDYNIDENGTITENGKYKPKKEGQISQEDMRLVTKRLEELTYDAPVSY